MPRPECTSLTYVAEVYGQWEHDVALAGQVRDFDFSFAPSQKLRK